MHAMPSDPSSADVRCPEGVFKCNRCGDCCKGYGGTYITREQMLDIANHIGMEPDRFLKEKCRISGGKPVLAQKEDGYCIFWDGLCTIYPVRPGMCRKWPFIESVLLDISNWQIMAGSCPGMRTDIPESVIRACVEKMLRMLPFTDAA